MDSARDSNRTIFFDEPTLKKVRLQQSCSINPNDYTQYTAPIFGEQIMIVPSSASDCDINRNKATGFSNFIKQETESGRPIPDQLLSILLDNNEYLSNTNEMLISKDSNSLRAKHVITGIRIKKNLDDCQFVMRIMIRGKDATKLVHYIEHGIKGFDRIVKNAPFTVECLSRRIENVIFSSEQLTSSTFVNKKNGEIGVCFRDGYDNQISLNYDEYISYLQLRNFVEKDYASYKKIMEEAKKRATLLNTMVVHMLNDEVNNKWINIPSFNAKKIEERDFAASKKSLDKLWGQLGRLID